METVGTHPRTRGKPQGTRPAAGLTARRAAFVAVLTALVFLLLAAGAQAYAPGQLIWAKRIGTSTSSAGAYAVAAGPNGATVIAGYRYIAEGAGYDVPLVAKYTAGGKRAWLRTYTTYAGWAEAVACDRNGNVYVAVKAWRQRDDLDWGYTIGLLKYDAAGRLKWERVDDGPAGDEYDQARIAVGSDGNVVVAGSSPAANGRLGIVAVKYRPNGDPAWPAAARLDSDPGDPTAGDVHCKALGVESAHGSVFVAGYSLSNTSGPWLESAVLVKFNALSGNKVWDKTYVAHGNPASWTDNIAVRGSSVVVTGSTGGPTDEVDALVVKYNVDGTLEHWKEWGVDNGKGEFFGGVTLDGKGNVFVTGDQWVDRGTATNKAITLRLNATLSKVVWKKTYQPTGKYAQGWFIARDGFGNVYVSGVRQNSAGDDDFLTMKYTATGTRAWLRTWSGGGPDDDWPYGIVLGTKGGVYVAGWVTGKGDVWQAALVKYQQ